MKFGLINILSLAKSRMNAKAEYVGAMIKPQTTLNSIGLLRNQFTMQGLKGGSHTAGFFLEETADYYGAAKNITLNFEEPPVVLLHFDDATQPFLNSGTAELETQATLNATISGNYGQFGTGAYLTYRSGQSLQGGLVGFELGDEDFTIELFASMKVNYATGTKDFNAIHQAYRPANSAWAVQIYKDNTTQQLLFFRYDDDTSTTGFVDVDLSPLQYNMRHIAFVYQHDLQKGMIFYNGVKVLEREIVCLRQPCLLYGNTICADEVRIMRAAMYTEDFTPPQSPF